MTTNNLDKTVNLFANSLGSGKKSLEYLLTMLEAVANPANRDTTILVRAMERAGKKGDVQAVAAIKLIIRNVWVGAKFGKDKNGKARIVIKDTTEVPEALQGLRDAVADGLSIRGNKWKEKVNLLEPPKRAEMTREVCDKMVAGMVERRAMTRAEVLAMAAAFEAQAKAMEAKVSEPAH